MSTSYKSLRFMHTHTHTHTRTHMHTRIHTRTHTHTHMHTHRHTHIHTHTHTQIFEKVWACGSKVVWVNEGGARLYSLGRSQLTWSAFRRTTFANFGLSLGMIPEQKGGTDMLCFSFSTQESKIYLFSRVGGGGRGGAALLVERRSLVPQCK